MKLLKAISFAAATVVLLYACSKSGSDTPAADSNDEFKKGMLINYADNLIIPAYTDLQAKLVLLESDINAFLAAPAAGTLKASFKNAYLGFEAVSAIYLGPSAALLLNNYVNTFPSVPSKIEASITSDSYNFNLPVASDSIQGLPVLDYLLFANDAVARFSAADAANRKQYVRDVIARIKLLVNYL